MQRLDVAGGVAPAVALLAAMGARSRRCAGSRRRAHDLDPREVLVFYLALLPQFLGPQAPLTALLALALSHAALSLPYLLVVVAGLARASRVLARRRVRRALDAATGTVLLGLGARLATK